MKRKRQSRAPGGVLETPPDIYSREYLARLTQRLEQIERAVYDLGDAQAATLYLYGLESDGANLAAGNVFQEDGVLKIVLADDQYAPSFLTQSSVGTVTVSTS